MSDSVDYKATLRLPRTDFPMRGNMAKREPEMLESWAQEDLQGEILRATADRPRYVLHDGPPYANGHIHYGHILNKVLKDIVIKYKTMTGQRAVYVPGWDCHGLPIELQVDRELKDRKAQMSVPEMRQACREYADRFVDIQRTEFKRLGVFGQWDEPYLTMTPQYEATIVRELARFAELGHLYKGKKPVHWCGSCRTALAEAEVEYGDHTSPSIYVKFRYKGDTAALAPALAGREVYFVIWTTTPWTIPANLAIALHPEFSYVAVEHEGAALVMARELVESVAKACGFEPPPIIAEIDPESVERQACVHPMFERDSLLVLGGHVTLEAGTGCVHTAPGHGHEDYVTGQLYGLEPYAPLDDRGVFTDEVPEYAGQHVFKANQPIVERLAELGALLNKVGDTVGHSYPHCWRCKQPVIFRATAQWFARIDHQELRKRALEQVDKTEWVPPWGHDRIYGMIERRPDWCLSRQRRWGVPIPAVYCEDCGEVSASAEMMRHVAELFAKEGADAWFVRDTAELLPPDTKCGGCGGTRFRKEQDIVDVWFESGVSWAAVCEPNADLWPIDLYLEGSDQHRGWFHSALLTAVTTRGAAPYRTVLTHGFVVNEKGQPYSKSLKNFIPPDRVIKERGAEIFRLWTAYVDYRYDMPFSDKILAQLGDSYRKIRNTCRFLLGNLAGFDPTAAVPQAALSELDQWALGRLAQVTARCRTAYETYDFHQVYRCLMEFCTTDLSAFYLDVMKDRLYCADDASRLGTQSVLYRLTYGLATLLAPVLSFTAEDIWAQLPKAADTPRSVHLAQIPAPGAVDEALMTRVEGLRVVRERVLKSIEPFRAEKHHSLDARVLLYADAKERELLESYSESLADLLIVSEVEVHAVEQGDGRVEVVEIAADKCGRCWKRSATMGDDPRWPDACPRCTAVLAEREQS